MQNKITHKTDLSYHPISLYFKEKIVENKFVDYVQNVLTKPYRISGVIMIFLVFLGGVLNWLISPEIYNISTLILWTIWYVVPAVFFFDYYFLSQKLTKYFTYFYVFYGIFLGIAITITYYLSEQNDTQYYFIGMNIVIVMYYFLVRLKYYWAILVGSFNSVLAIIGLHVIDPGGSDYLDILYCSFYILAINATGIYIAYQFSKYIRDNFVSNLRADIERGRVEMVLDNVLPKKIALQLKEAGTLLDDEFLVEDFENVSILFVDIVGFTSLSSRITSKELIKILNQVFSTFDKISDKYGVEKIKTIGDAYMLAAGVPDKIENPAKKIAQAALDIQKAIFGHDYELNVRIGIACGPLVAGVIGNSKFLYDLWGDTVNTASRMESHSLPGKIQVTKDFYEQVRSDFNLTSRGLIEVKGKGELETWWLESKKLADI